jgi:hypothetical protein
VEKKFRLELKNIYSLQIKGQFHKILYTVPKIRGCRGDNPLHTVIVSNIYDRRAHFLKYSVLRTTEYYGLSQRHRRIFGTVNHEVRSC